ncbi:hypothetical protein HDU76_007730 [Blyttiomyces sp. JEL0837]|nr:hypothetical protein HDU76_007730 [Blyttiomyces sp. JEL0837]
MSSSFIQEESVAELAASNQAARRQRRLFPAIPIWVVIVLLFIVTIGAVVAPLGVIFISSSNNSLNQISRTTIQLAVSQAGAGVANVMAGTQQVLERFTNDSYAPQDFISNVNNLKNSPTLFGTMMKSVRSHDYISAFICATPGTTLTDKNRTIAQALYTSSFPGAKGPTPIMIYLDTSTNGMNQMAVLSPDFKSILASNSLGPARAADGNDKSLNDMLSGNPTTGIYFDISYINASTSLQFWQMSFYKNFWVNEPTSTPAPVPNFACSIGFQIDGSFTPLLNSIRVTDNAILMLMESSTGRLLSTNRLNSISAQNNITLRITPDQSPVAEIAMLGSGLLAEFGSYQNIPALSVNEMAFNSTLDVRQRVLSNNQAWFFGAASIPVKGANFVLVVGFPRSDIFGQIDAAAKVGVIAASSVAVIGLGFMGLMTFLAMRPLKKMCSNMEKLTKFDFSALEQSTLTHRSGLAEIRQIETVFDTMVLGFASAIRKNRSLAQGHTFSSATKSQY